MLGGMAGMVIAAPLAGVVLGRLFAARGRLWGPAAAFVAFAGASVVAVAVASGGARSWELVTAGHSVVVGLQVDALSAALLPLITGVSAVVQVFARRYLYGDARTEYFYTATALLTSASAALVCASTLFTLAAAWTAAGIALCLLLRMYSALPQAQDGFRRTARAFLVGDAALWAAAVIASVMSGPVDLRATAPVVADQPLATVVALLVVLAAASRSAQIPFHRWLPATLAAPTPVSALLHAGVVNAAAILLFRLTGITTSAPVAVYAVFGIGACTAVYATVLMLTKPDIKGALAHSTMAQMGFMVMTCGLGLFGAAVFHLISHGMYKATLFLGSGAAVDQHRRESQAARPSRLTRRATVALLVFSGAVPVAILCGAAVLMSTVIPNPELAAKSALLAFAWATSAWACWAWLRPRPTVRRALSAAVVMLAVLPVYLAALSAFNAVLQPPAGAPGVSAWLLAPVLLALLAVAALRRPTPRFASVHALLYAWALNNGHPRTAPPVRTTIAPRLLNPSMTRTPVEVPA